MQPDVVFCHGPFHQADYRVAQTLLEESVGVISFADPAVPLSPSPMISVPTNPTDSDVAAVSSDGSGAKSGHHSLSEYLKKGQTKGEVYLKTGQERFNELMQKGGISLSRPTSPSPPDATTSTQNEAPNTASDTPEGTHSPAGEKSSPTLVPAQVPLPTFTTHPRRLVILVVGISPHRKLWTTSQRPGESVIGYSLLNGAPGIVVPAKEGSPLMAWDTLTLDSLHKIGVVEGPKFDGVVQVLFEYVALCADWERFKFPDSLEENDVGEEEKGMMSQEELAQRLTKNALMLLVAAAIRSKDSKEVKKYVDADRAGIAMLRLP